MSATARLAVLFAALIYDSDAKDNGTEGYLNVWQRIFINQERGYLLQDHIHDADYKQSLEVNQKIEFIMTKLKTEKVKLSEIQDKVNNHFNN